MWNLFESVENAFYHGKKILNNKLNTIILPKTNSNKIIILPCHRFEEYYKYIELSRKKYSYRELFSKLKKFYTKTELLLKELINIPDDIDNYKNDAIKLIKNNKKIYMIDIMGSLCRFEGIRTIENFEHIFYLILGS